MPLEVAVASGSSLSDLLPVQSMRSYQCVLLPRERCHTFPAIVTETMSQRKPFSLRLLLLDTLVTTIQR